VLWGGGLIKDLGILRCDGASVDLNWCLQCGPNKQENINFIELIPILWFDGLPYERDPTKIIC